MYREQTGSEKARSTVAYLRARILDGDWPVNGRIPRESELMEAIGVGKSTVREAVRSLAAMGMLETVRGVGTFVRSRTPVSAVLSDAVGGHELADVLSLRRALEVEAARLAAARRTELQLAALRRAVDLDRHPAEHDRVQRGRTPGEFHQLVFDAAGSPLLSGLYAGVLATVRAAVAGGRVSRAGAAERQADHEALLEAISLGDQNAAGELMAEHVDRDLQPTA